jgi:hypothetical protein
VRLVLVPIIARERGCIDRRRRSRPRNERTGSAVQRVILPSYIVAVGTVDVWAASTMLPVEMAASHGYF